ncbi:MAG: endonuclease III [Candidatus Rokubacteria bacterium]|nr:endonuclease III [Candidatus Rokubacteria bacterium]
MFIILSQMTTHQSLRRVYDRLKAESPTWLTVSRMSESRLGKLIGGAGLSRRRVPQLQTIPQRLQRDFGEATLEPLRLMETPAAERYLLSLPGVGPKTAKCVLMYSLGREVLPVDTHVQRVAVRLGLVPASTRYSELHDALENVVPAVDRYAFHVNAVAHGRSVCVAPVPRCHLCRLRSLCRFAGRWRRPTRRDHRDRAGGEDFWLDTRKV